jgi:hypothetical protein
LSPENTDRRIAEISCDVIAWGSHRSSAADLPALRKSPGTLGVEPLPNGLLRHVDEQTVVAVAAVLEAIRASGMGPSGFGRWSVLAAPRFLGRAKFEKAFPQYREEGGWGVSPHLVPGHSLHSPSGTISQVLHAHGPNLGIGGTPGGERQALLVAATWLDAGWSEGVWLVVTSRDPEATGEVAISEPGDYRASTLALVASRPGSEGPRLLIGPDAIALQASPDDRPGLAEILDGLGLAEDSVVGRKTPWRADAGHDAVPASHAPSSPAILRRGRDTRP